MAIFTKNNYKATLNHSGELCFSHYVVKHYSDTKRNRMVMQKIGTDFYLIDTWLQRKEQRVSGVYYRDTGAFIFDLINEDGARERYIALYVPEKGEILIKEVDSESYKKMLFECMNTFRNGGIAV